MENNTPTEVKKESPKISTPMAIIVAGALIMAGIIITNGPSRSASVAEKNSNKSLSEQLGISKTEMAKCLEGIDATALNTSIAASVDAAMKGIPSNQRGTPYAIMLGVNGIKSDMKGAGTYEQVKQMVDDVKAGKADSPYTGNVPPVTAADHILGSTNALVTIVEYSDYECPYCKQFNPVLHQIVTDSNGTVAWVYRHYPIHQHSFEKLSAAECVAKIKGNDAFWKYSNLLFGLLQTAEQAPSISEQL